MGFGPARDLPLDAVLGEHYVRHYLRILASANPLFYVIPEPDQPGQWTTAAEQPYPQAERDEPGIDKRGNGPAQCSSSTVLATYPLHCWDVKGYYRRLGVDWKASRRELADAYMLLGGPDDPSLTYAFKQLLHEPTRHAYDRVPLGGRWLDEEEQGEIREKAAREAARRAASGKAVGAYDEILQEWGYERVRKDPGVAERSRERDLPEQEELGPEDSALGSTVSQWEVRWGWYLLGDARPPRRPGDRLEEWQRLLVQAFGAADLRIYFGVGFFSGVHFKLWRNTRNMCIVFLADNELPTPALAHEAVKGYLAHEHAR